MIRTILYSFLLCFFILSLPAEVAAQGFNPHETCGSDQYLEAQLNDPAVRARYEALESKAKAQGKWREGGAIRSHDSLVFPVVVHVLHTYGDENISDDLIHDALSSLNDNFNARNASLSSVRDTFKDIIGDMKITFRLATVDPEGRCTNGITRTYSELTHRASDSVKNIIRWDTDHYMNIWVVDEIADDNPLTRTLGYAQFPFAGSKSTDGLVVVADQVNIKGTTITHEVGHYLGLFHPFQGGCSNGDCSRFNDRVCDTPPVSNASFGCSATKNSCNTDNPDQIDMVENFMDYSSCSYAFTEGQVERAEIFFFIRESLFSAQNLQETGVYDDPLCAPVADFFTVLDTICAGETVLYIPVTSNAPVNTYQWAFAGGTADDAQAKEPAVTYTSPGTYEATLTVSNSRGSDVITKKAAITVLPSVGSLRAPIVLGFEEASQVQAVNADSNNLSWERTSEVAFAGDYSLKLNNFNGIDNYEYQVDLGSYDLRGVKDPALRMWVAYSQKPGQGQEGLIVYFAEDCKKVYRQLDLFRVRDLVQNDSDILATPYVPTSTSEWMELVTPLDRYSGSSNLSLRLEFVSRGGNNIYIDAWEVTGLTSINETNRRPKGLVVYPQPATNSFTLRAQEELKGQGILNLYSIDGKLISRQSVSLGGKDLTLTTGECKLVSSGLYLLQLVTPNASYTCRLSFAAQR